MATGDDYKVVCYYESWAIYREEPMTTSPADVDPFGCTHVIYSFLGLDKTSLTVTILDPDYEVIRGKKKNLISFISSILFFTTLFINAADAPPFSTMSRVDNN